MFNWFFLCRAFG